MKKTYTDTDVFLSETSHTGSTIAPGEILIGSLVGINAQGQPLVEYPESPVRQSLPAISTLGITPQHIGRQVALLFAHGNPHSPVIIGIIHSPLQALLETHESAPVTLAEPAPVNRPDMDLKVDGKRVVIEGREEIVLRCGEASITLTQAGEILIRGKYLLSSSKGVNWVMGNSVRVN